MWLEIKLIYSDYCNGCPKLKGNYTDDGEIGKKCKLKYFKNNTGELSSVNGDIRFWYKRPIKCINDNGL